MSFIIDPTEEMKKLFTRKGIKDTKNSIVSYHIPDKSNEDVGICEKKLNPEVFPYSKYGPYCQFCIRKLVRGTVNG